MKAVMLVFLVFALSMIGYAEEPSLLDMDYSNIKIEGVSKKVLKDLDSARMLYDNNRHLSIIAITIPLQVKQQVRFESVLNYLLTKRDRFALIINTLKNLKGEKKAVKELADIGEPFFQLYYTENTRDKSIGIFYLKAASHNGSVFATHELMSRYDVKDYGCETIVKAYQKHGLDTFSELIIKKEYVDKLKVIQQECAILPKEMAANLPESLLNYDSDEAKYIKAVREYKLGNVTKAISLLETLEKSKDKRILANVFYCLCDITKDDSYCYKAKKNNFYFADSITFKSGTVFTNMSLFCH